MKLNHSIETQGYHSINPYLIWGCGALFYMFQFVLRVAPAVIVKDLMNAFHVDASAIGALSAMSMYSYSLLQVPSGLLADRFGVKRIITGSLILCILGSALFAISSSIWVAQLGRFIIGAGSSAAFLSSGKIALSYFSEKRRASFFGFTMAAGTVGALNGGVPLSYLVDTFGWRESILILCVIGVLVLLLTLFVFRNERSEATTSVKQQGFIEGLSEVLTHPIVWIHAIVAIGLYLSISVFADVWGPSFIVERFQVTKHIASKSVSFMYVGLFIGSLVIPFVSDLLNRRREIIILCIFATSALLCALLYATTISLPLISLIFFLIGFVAGAEMLCFAGACEAVSPQRAGTVTGLVNGVVMLSSALAQHQVGVLLDQFWSGGVSESNIRTYSSIEFQQALTLVPIVTGLCCLASLYLALKTRAAKSGT